MANANALQYQRIARIHAILNRRNTVALEIVAKAWITRYAAAWRRNHNSRICRQGA